ncbi:MAG TPA: OsmC family protein, partial [Flavobacteriales bacterium]|nr:OsmC family protein [Flavobacteriales bacterium]
RTIAHEVRNPLTNISLAVEQLRELGVQHEEYQLLLDMVSRNAVRINQLSNNLLNATKFEELNVRRHSINQLLDETLEMAKDRIDLQHITVEVDHDKAHIGDCAQPGGPTARIDRFRCRVRMEGDLTPEQRQRILEIADRCPVHRTLVGGVKIQSELVDRA